MFHFFEDVPSEIVIWGSLQGALGAILGSLWGRLDALKNQYSAMLDT